MADIAPTIEQALEQLDKSNPNHWTSDGLPKIDYMRHLTRNASLTRDMVESAVPGFTRNGIVKKETVVKVEPDVEKSEVQESATTGTGTKTVVIAEQDQIEIELKEIQAEIFRAKQQIGKIESYLVNLFRKEAELLKVSTPKVNEIHEHLKRVRANAQEGKYIDYDSKRKK